MESKLFEAAASDNVEVLEELFRGNVDDVFNKVTPAKNTALHIAAYYGSKRFVEMLLQKTNQSNLGGGTSGSGSHGFLAKQNLQGNTALHEAASTGHVEIVEKLVKQNHELASMANNAGETAVFKASLAGHWGAMEMFEKLLGFMSLEMYKRKSDGQTALHFAVFNKQPGRVKELLNHKPALVSEADDLGRTPLHVAALIPLLKELVPPFHPWMHKKHVDQILSIVDMLLKKDKSLCYKLDNNSQCALHIAVKQGNVKMVKLILSYGRYCIESLDQDGRNALHLAIMNAEQIFDRNSEAITPILNFLVSESKMLINDRDKGGKTPLNIAIANMDKDEPLFSEIIKLLKANGAIHNSHMVVKTEEEEAKTSPLKSKWRSEIISLNAVLIATVAFAAPFDLINKDILTGDDFHKGPYAQRVFYIFLFYVFVISDTIAFGASMVSAILLLFAVFGKKEDSPMVETSFVAVMIALLSLLVTFGSAITLTLGRKYLWLALAVWFMLGVVPLAIRVRTFHSKLYLFTENQNFNKFIFEDLLGLILNLIWWVLDIVKTLYWWGIIYPAIQWVKKPFISIWLAIRR